MWEARSTPRRTTRPGAAYRRTRPTSPATISWAWSPSFADATEEQWIARHGQGARVVVRASSPAIQLEAIRRGHGIGLHACHSAERAEGVLRLSDEVLLSEEYWAIVHVDLARAARVKAVLDFLSERTEVDRVRLAGTIGA